MSLFRLAAICLLLAAGGAFAQVVPSATPPASAVGLDFEFFKTRVEPIFTAKRPGHARCVACHGLGTRMRLRPLPDGAETWNDADSRLNFEAVRTRIVPGNPDASRLLRHPLAQAAGGDPVHDGGKHWTSKDDPEWQTLAAWVRGATLAGTAPAPLHLRIIQTNNAGDDVHIIDPATNKIVGRIEGIEVSHGVAVSPDGSRIYISSEANATLNVVDSRTLRVISKIALSGRPNNIAMSRDGSRIYVAINKAPGAVDVVDTSALQRVKTIPIKGGGHNTYVTPDGRYVVAGSVVGKTLTVIDQKTEEPLWVMEFTLGVRPIAFEANRNGSTKRMFVQLSDFNGFSVIDFATHKEVKRIELPSLPPDKARVHLGGNTAHGIAVSADNSRLIVSSRPNSAVYIYALPSLKLLGGVDVGLQPEWVTLTPDGRTAYVANAGSNDVSAVDMVGLREIARIPAGQAPKRNIAAMLP
ncbi:MAG TPA: cytochrome D1 domain-containing protein [Caulobacterales bacterium]|nr:cytochrome D1 domain-containing protein [Caulobacterales bacterium]